MVSFFIGGEIMPINGLPSDEWKVKQALGPYAEPMDEDELEKASRLLQKKKEKTAAASSSDQEFKMPF
jgi:hypothetical protein